MPLLCSLQVKSMTFSLGCPRSLVDLKDSGDELMPTMSAFLYPVESCRTSAWLLTSPFHGGVDSRGQIRELRVLMSPQSGVLAVCKAQSVGSSPPSHNTSPSSVAAMSGRHCSLIHTIPAPQQRSAVCRGHSHSHDSSPTSAAVVGRGHPLIYMIPAPHQRRRCEDFALSILQGDMGPSVQRSHLIPLHRKTGEDEESIDGPARKSAQWWGVSWCPCGEKRAKVRSHLTPRLAAIDGDGSYTGVKPQLRYVTCPPWHRLPPPFRFYL